MLSSATFELYYGKDTIQNPIHLSDFLFQTIIFTEEVLKSEPFLIIDMQTLKFVKALLIENLNYSGKNFEIFSFNSLIIVPLSSYLPRY